MCKSYLSFLGARNKGIIAEAYNSAIDSAVKAEYQSKDAWNYGQISNSMTNTESPFAKELLEKNSLEQWRNSCQQHEGILKDTNQQVQFSEIPMFSGTNKCVIQLRCGNVILSPPASKTVPISESPPKSNAFLRSNSFSSDSKAFGIGSLNHGGNILPGFPIIDIGRSKSFSAPTSDRMPHITWHGPLKQKQKFVVEDAIYSPKVFLGGLPFDMLECDLQSTFHFCGKVQIQWPPKGGQNVLTNHSRNGFCYLIMETSDQVSKLLKNCVYRDGKFFFTVGSRRCPQKQIEVIPFNVGDRFYMKPKFSGQIDQNMVVFVGGLHGMITADNLATIMQELFGNVVYVGLDTDKYKYPLGSGRVAFSEYPSFLKAIHANFIEIISGKIRKTIQVEPFVYNDNVCSNCRVSLQGSNEEPYFCRDLTCFCYFCQNCWYTVHTNNPELAHHRYVSKKK